MSDHKPVVREVPSQVSRDVAAAVVSCECGWVDPYVWSTVIGARSAYLVHVLTAHFPPEWPGSFDVDYDPEGRSS